MAASRSRDYLDEMKVDLPTVMLAAGGLPEPAVWTGRAGSWRGRCLQESFSDSLSASGGVRTPAANRLLTGLVGRLANGKHGVAFCLSANERQGRHSGP
jgi:hypothetical protein